MGRLNPSRLTTARSARSGRSRFQAALARPRGVAPGRPWARFPAPGRRGEVAGIVSARLGRPTIPEGPHGAPPSLHRPPRPAYNPRPRFRPIRKRPSPDRCCSPPAHGPKAVPTRAIARPLCANQRGPSSWPSRHVRSRPDRLAAQRARRRVSPPFSTARADRITDSPSIRPQLDLTAPPCSN